MIKTGKRYLIQPLRHSCQYGRFFYCQKEGKIKYQEINTERNDITVPRGHVYNHLHYIPL